MRRTVLILLTADPADADGYVEKDYNAPDALSFRAEGNFFFGESYRVPPRI